MKNQINLNITTPCSEDFNQFSPTAKGGFCGSCEKEVIDFTTMNAQEIITFFKNKETENTCGRFKSNQLTTYNQQPEKSKIRSILSGIGLACLSIFSMTSAQAQEIKKVETTGNSSEINTVDQQQEIEVKGTIVDESGLPLPGVNIILEGSVTGIATDFDGYFEFPEKLKRGDVLVFSYIGYTSKKLVIENKNSISKINLQVDMTLDDVILMGRVASNKVYSSKK